MTNVLSGLSKWFTTKPKGERRDATGWESWAPSLNLSGVQVTPRTALALTALYSCVTVICENIASLPFETYRRLPGNGREPDPNHPNYDLLRFEVSEEVGAFGFWSSIVGDACLEGNGYAEIERDIHTGQPIALHKLNPQTTRVKRADSGQIIYETTKEEDGPTGNPGIILQENVLHIALFGPNGIVGYNPIDLCRETFGVGLASQKTAAAAFGQSSLPNGIIEVPEDMDDTAIKTLREYWNKIHQGPFNSSKIGILYGGAKFNATAINLQTLQFIETQKLTAQQICQLYKVPQHKAGILDNATYSNIEEQDLDFYKSTLRLWCQRIECEVMRKLFTRNQRKTHFAEFNMNVILRGNSIARTDNLVKLFGTGVHSVDSACLEAGLNPVCGELGKLRFVQSNLVQLSLPSPSAPSNPTVLPEVPDPVSEPQPA